MFKIIEVNAADGGGFHVDCHCGWTSEIFETEF